MATEKEIGKWGSVFDTRRVAVHATVLPNGRIICWGRRANPNDPKSVNLDEQFTRPFFIDLPFSPKDNFLVDESKLIKNSSPDQDIKDAPKFLDTLNLFCSGHCLQPDGSLLVAGGHKEDGLGIDQACTYDYLSNKWTPLPKMNDGRWYPSVTTLPDGNALVISGSHVPMAQSDWTTGRYISNIPQILHPDPTVKAAPSVSWVTAPSPPGRIIPLYPKLHLDPKGRIFVAGPQAESLLINLDANVNNNRTIAWEFPGSMRSGGACEYGSSAMHEDGKVLWTGGGNPPIKKTEIMDLNKEKLTWVPSKDMEFARRQHNATVLPDGSVLVTGGSSGAGGFSSPPGFNDLTPGVTVHKAELWSEAKGWKTMAEEVHDRCYHSIALLLPNGQVLSASGGEYGDAIGARASNTLTNAQLFSPPYLCQGVDRPTILNPLPTIEYGKNFTITVGPKDNIKQASLMRLGSVTHTTNMNQLRVKLVPTQTGTSVQLTGPANPNIAPPGHYMLFVMNEKGVPCVAPIIQIKLSASKPATTLMQRARMAEQPAISLLELDQKVMDQHDQPVTLVGLTPICPYGLGPCWGGAFEALQHISDIKTVRPAPSQADSVAFVYLKNQDSLPDIDVWRREFSSIARSSYEMRGIEVTLSGAGTRRLDGKDQVGQLLLVAEKTRPEVVLAPYQQISNIRYDFKAGKPKPITKEEAEAYAQLFSVVDPDDRVTLKVTGTLQKHGEGKYSLEVRAFSM
ncbi:Galactose oxidase [Pseudocercospora fuligena]|uniref:Galactose oxidase n=1 Tax=Pseudocercospora fuligena TaxID=685502 RepID=A0A8H6RIA7_9PEZI|nr:Galactose oxidase [Pseudocercospora fuligena]